MMFTDTPHGHLQAVRALGAIYEAGATPPTILCDAAGPQSIESRQIIGLSERTIVPMPDRYVVGWGILIHLNGSPAQLEAVPCGQNPELREAAVMHEELLAAYDAHPAAEALYVQRGVQLRLTVSGCLFPIAAAAHRDLRTLRQDIMDLALHDPQLLSGSATRMDHYMGAAWTSPRAKAPPRPGVLAWMPLSAVAIYHWRPGASPDPWADLLQFHAALLEVIGRGAVRRPRPRWVGGFERGLDAYFHRLGLQVSATVARRAVYWTDLPALARQDHRDRRRARR